MAKKDRRNDAPIEIEEDRRLGRDRRQWERVLVDLEVDYRSDDTFLFAYITDISAMGIFVRTTTPEPVGARLNLRFNVPGQGMLELEGAVIWINPFRPGDRENLNPGMGVQFIGLGPEQRKVLRETIKTFAYLDGEAATSDDDDGDDERDGDGDDDDRVRDFDSDDISIPIPKGDA
jgi:type IV pilus assembly protein PilZ